MNEAFQMMSRAFCIVETWINKGGLWVIRKSLQGIGDGLWLNFDGILLSRESGSLTSSAAWWKELLRHFSVWLSILWTVLDILLECTFLSNLNLAFLLDFPIYWSSYWELSVLMGISSCLFFAWFISSSDPRATASDSWNLNPTTSAQQYSAVARLDKLTGVECCMNVNSGADITLLCKLESIAFCLISSRENDGNETDLIMVLI